MPLPLLIPLTSLAFPVASVLGHTINTNKTTKTSKKIAEKQHACQLKLAHLNIQAQKNLEVTRQQFQVNLEASRQQFQERMLYLGFRQQLTLREFDQQFQLRLRELDYEHQQEIEEFRAQVNIAINQKNLDFQAWKFEQEIALQQEMAHFNRETQLSIAAYQRETALQLPEVNKIYENWPLKILPTQILNSHPNHLRIFISPPALDYDRFTNLSDPKSHHFPKIEGFLGTRLLKLLNQHYPRNDARRPTQLLDGAWDSKRFAGSASILALTDSLESEPLMVLETKVILNKYLSLQVAYKGIGQKEYFYDEVMPRFEYGNILLAVAKTRIGTVPVDTQNIQVMPDDWEVLYEVLEVAHCIVAAWIADVHHLIYNNTSPLLPHFLPELVQELPDFLLTDANSLLIHLMQAVVKGYNNVFQTLELTEQCYQVPALFLELARGLASLPKPSMMAKAQTKESILAFLRTRNYADLKVINHRKQIENLLVYGDNEYFDQLEKFIASTSKENVIPEATHLLRVWCELKPRLEQQFRELESIRRQEEAERLEQQFREQESIRRQEAEKERQLREEIRQQEMDRQPTEEHYHSGIDYCNLIAFPPNSSNLKPRQWLHKASYEYCEGELQIGDDATIFCEFCDIQMPIMDWFLVDDDHLSEQNMGYGKKMDTSSAISFGGQLIIKKGQRWFEKLLSRLEEDEQEPEPQREQPKYDDAEYHHLVVSPPTSPQSKPRQWLHKSSYERCEGKLQIGDNGIIRCQRCHTQMPALEWYIVDNGHLSELDGKPMAASDAISFAGQLVIKTGQTWMMQFLAHLEE